MKILQKEIKQEVERGWYGKCYRCNKMEHLAKFCNEGLELNFLERKQNYLNDVAKEEYRKNNDIRIEIDNGRAEYENKLQKSGFAYYERLNKENIEAILDTGCKTTVCGEL